MKEFRCCLLLLAAVYIVVLFGNTICAFAVPLKNAHQHLASTEDKLTRFVMISMQRSGTGWLWLTFNSHPCITMAGDGVISGKFWNTSNTQHGIDLFFDEGMQMSNDADKAFFESTPKKYQMNYNNVKDLKGPEAWVDQNTFAFYPEVNRSDDQNKTGDARGFVWHIKERVFENWPWFVKFCKKHDVKIIWLQRQHLLRQFISHYALKRDGSAHTYSEEKAETMRNNKLTISISVLLKSLEKWEKENVHMKSLLTSATLDSVKTLSLVYEEMLKAPRILDDAAAFVLKDSMCKIKHSSPPKNDFIKVHAGDLKDLIANWPEVQAALNGTHFEYLLKD